MLANGFPTELHSDAAAVLPLVSKRTCSNVKFGETEHHCSYTLLDGQTISFPYRIYYLDECERILPALTSRQKMIYHAVFSRSSDGFVREQHIKELLSEEYPDWAIPYILKLSDEYVMEILETVYQEMSGKSTAKAKAFCSLNMQSFLRSHDRMISYWNEFYRYRYCQYKDYIGRKLFSECFGYTRSMEKIRELKT